MMNVRKAMTAGGVAAVLVLSGCGSNASTSRKLGNVNASGPNTTLEIPSNANRVGDVVKLGDAEVTVHAFKDPFEAGNLPGKLPGTRYVMVDAEVRNRASAPRVLSAFSQFELKDSEGETYEPIALPGQPAVGGVAEPGAARRGVVAFQIPESAKGLQVVFNNLLYGGGTASIYLA